MKLKTSTKSPSRRQESRSSYQWSISRMPIYKVFLVICAFYATCMCMWFYIYSTCFMENFQLALSSSLPLAPLPGAVTAGTGGALPGAAMGTNSASLLHVISPFHATECQSPFCPYDQEQNVTIGSMLQAKEAFGQGSVTLVAAVSEKDMEVAVPRGFHALPALTRSTETEYKNLKPSKSLPFFQDIVDRVLDDDELTFDYLIYTNSDIILHENFYSIVQQQIELYGHDFFTINRRTVSKGKEELYTAADLDKIYSEEFEIHPGTDCFVIKRSIVEKLDLQDVFIGTMFFSTSLVLQARFHSVSYASFKSTDLQATYHLGDDREWGSGRMEHYLKQNAMNAVCENGFFKNVCMPNNSPLLSLLPEGVGRECKKLERKMHRFIDKSYHI